MNKRLRLTYIIPAYKYQQVWLRCVHFKCENIFFAIQTNLPYTAIPSCLWKIWCGVFWAANNNRENLFTKFDSLFPSQNIPCGIHQTNCKTKTNLKPWIQRSHPIKLKDAFKKLNQSINQRETMRFNEFSSTA